MGNCEAHPNHYSSGGDECWDVMCDLWGDEALATFCKMNAFKYIWRLGHKDDPVKDARKAINYLEKFCEVSVKNSF